MKHKNDISAKRLFLSELTYVGEGERRPNCKKLEVVSRHSDAFVFVRGGNCEYTFSDGITFVVSPGNLVFLPCASAYTMRHFNNAFSYIYFDFRFLTESKCIPACFSPRNPEEIGHLFRRILHSFEGFPDSSFCECAELFYRIYASVLQSAEGIYLSASIKQKILHADEYIAGHYSEKGLTISHLSEMCGVSDTYFRRMYKNLLGVCPNRRINMARLESVERMLGDSPELSLEKIAELCGFCSVQYMTAMFKREYGISPGKFRKKGCKSAG